MVPVCYPIWQAPAKGKVARLAGGGRGLLLARFILDDADEHGTACQFDRRPPSGSGSQHDAPVS
jgi:hypothetical protein